MSKYTQTFSIDTNTIVDDGTDTVSFTNSLTITDDSTQWNDTRYDIPSMKLDAYKDNLTANHSNDIQEIIGKTFGVKKQGNKVTIDGIKFATKESALAQFSYDMIKGGFLTDFSIETVGPPPDDDGVYHDAELVGLSAVVMGNNKSAAINEVALNSVKKAQKNGLDTSSVEKVYLNGQETKNGEQETNLEKGMKEKVKNEEEVKEEVKEEVQDEPKEEVKEDAPAEKTDESVSELIKSAFTEVNEKIDAIEQKVFDNSAKEPEFTKTDVKAKSVSNELSSMDHLQRTQNQINYAWDYLKGGNQEAGKKLEDVNKFHVEALQKEGKVSNAMTIADFGNFVISPELLSDIEGFRSDFASFLSILEFRETLSLQMSWLTRDGDVDMTEVENCNDGADGELKPISEYTANINTSNLQELAAVTPVCNNATRFLATDMIGDISQGYRTDHDRKKSQLAIARMQQAVDATGQSITYATTSDVNSLKSWIDTWTLAQEEIMGGVFIFNQKTYGQLLSTAIGAGISGPLAGLFTTGDQPLIAGSPYIVVPNELLPTLNTAETKSFTVEGATVTITEAVFYIDASKFSGRQSGGLSFDLSTEAAYEESGTVKSAFQRNELVLRGSFFRGAAIRDTSRVVGMSAPGVS